jgi:cell wall-associated NlpC family hydrolase
MLRLLPLVLAPAPLFAQALVPSLSLGGITLSAEGRAVRISHRGASIDLGGSAAARSRKPSVVSATRVLTTADRYVGTKYKWGGTSPIRGFDCSGFVQHVFSKHRVELPRTSRQQVRVGHRLPARVRGLRKGDLLFFAGNGSRIDHVAIYAGNDRIIHSSSSGGGVRYDHLGSKRGRWFAQRLVGARRVIADGRSLIDALDAELRLTIPLDPADLAPTP